MMESIRAGPGDVKVVRLDGGYKDALRAGDIPDITRKQTPRQ